MRIWETSLKTFGNDMRELRLDERLTQAELSRRIGLSLYLISRLENGLITPSFDTLGKIMKALRIDEVRMVK